MMMMMLQGCYGGRYLLGSATAMKNVVLSRSRAAVYQPLRLCSYTTTTASRRGNQVYPPLFHSRRLHSSRAAGLSVQRRTYAAAAAASSSQAAGSVEERRQFQDFDLTDGVYVVTGGARGLGLSLATGIADAGGTVHCLDRLPQSDASFSLAQRSIHPASPGSLHYAQVDVTDAASLNDLVASIAEKHGRMDGCVAAAGIQRICPALDYGMKEAREMLDTNLLGVLNTACAVARQAYRFPPPPLPPLSGLPASSSSSSEESNVSHASIVLIASMSGMIANKGLICPIYNASKAGVTQLARNLAMEWGKPQLYPGTPQHLEDLASPPLELLETVSSSSSSRGTAGRGGRRAKPRVSIRVNALSPGHIITPMVERNFEEVPGLREIWEKESMLGRLSRPEEFRGAAVFLLSRASSYMTGSNLIIDAGHTCW